MEMKPSIPPYGRQLFVCTNGNCATTEQAKQLLQQLGALHRKHGLQRFSNPQRIVHVPCGCLGVCVSGPILVVYPDGIWYWQVNEERLNRIYREHLLEGKPVEEYVFHRHFPTGQEPPYAPDLREDAVDPLQRAAEESAAEKAAEAKNAVNNPPPPHVRAARIRRQRRHDTD